MPHGIEVDEAFCRENISGRVNAEIVEAKEISFRRRAGELEPLPGLLDFLGSVKKRGLKTGLVTNAPGENVGAVLPALRLDDYFDAVVTAGESGAGKPDPASYRAALKKLAAEPGEALAFEDSVSGIASAVGAGIPTVGIASTQNPERLREAGVLMVAKDFTDPDLRALIGD